MAYKDLRKFILFISDLRFQAVMGGLLAVVFISSMLATLFVLPTLVILFRPGFIFRGKEEAWNKNKEVI